MNNRSQSETNITHASSLRWLQFDAYIFDIDGTLLNSRDLVHYRAFQKVLKEVFKCDRDITEVHVHGNTDVGILRATTRLAGISDEDFARNLPEVLEAMGHHVAASAHDFRPEICPSIPRLLDELKSRGKLLGVATGNLEAIAWPKLQAADLKHYFSFGSFSDRNEHRSNIFRAAAENARNRLGTAATICFVGDTPDDIKAARENNCPILAIATGIYPLEQLQALNPDFCLRCGDDLFPT